VINVGQSDVGNSQMKKHSRFCTMCVLCNCSHIWGRLQCTHNWCEQISAELYNITCLHDSISQNVAQSETSTSTCVQDHVKLDTFQIQAVTIVQHLSTSCDCTKRDKLNKGYHDVTAYSVNTYTYKHVRWFNEHFTVARGLASCPSESWVVQNFCPLFDHQLTPEKRNYYYYCIHIMAFFPGQPG